MPPEPPVKRWRKLGPHSERTAEFPDPQPPREISYSNGVDNQGFLLSHPKSHGHDWNRPDESPRDRGPYSTGLEAMVKAMPFDEPDSILEQQERYERIWLFLEQLAPPLNHVAAMLATGERTKAIAEQLEMTLGEARAAIRTVRAKLRAMLTEEEPDE